MLYQDVSHDYTPDLCKPQEQDKSATLTLLAEVMSSINLSVSAINGYYTIAILQNSAANATRECELSSLSYHKLNAHFLMQTNS